MKTMKKKHNAGKNLRLKFEFKDEKKIRSKSIADKLKFRESINATIIHNHEKIKK